MSKRYDEAIEVIPDPLASGDSPGVSSRAPLAFSWRGRRYEIDQQLASWREGAEWWHARGPSTDGNGRGPRDRDCYRVLARPAGALATGDLDADGFMTPPPLPAAVYDLAFDRIRNSWLLARVWD